MTFTLGGSTWGIGQFDRLGDAPRFSDDERAWLERVTPIVARGLRQALVAGPPTTPVDRGPGVVLLDLDGAVLSVTPEATAWLDELDATAILSAGGLDVPFEAHAYVAKVRAAVAPLIVEAYELTQRELEVTRLVARGLGTSQIAAELFLSAHTVRDHIKAVFEKVGVSSRGELVAKVFADHYAPPPHA